MLRQLFVSPTVALTIFDGLTNETTTNKQMTGLAPFDFHGLSFYSSPHLKFISFGGSPLNLSLLAGLIIHFLFSIEISLGCSKTCLTLINKKHHSDLNINIGSSQNIQTYFRRMCVEKFTHEGTFM